MSMSPPVTSLLHGCWIFTLCSLWSNGRAGFSLGRSPLTHMHSLSSLRQGPGYRQFTDPMPRTLPSSGTRTVALFSPSFCPGTTFPEPPPLLDWRGFQVFHLVNLPCTVLVIGVLWGVYHGQPQLQCLPCSPLPVDWLFMICLLPWGLTAVGLRQIFRASIVSTKCMPSSSFSAETG